MFTTYPQKYFSCPRYHPLPRFARQPHNSGRLYRQHYNGTMVSEASWRAKDLSSCVTSGDSECSLTPGQAQELPSTYLCGQADHCRLVADRDAINQAKHNVEVSYAVVGVLEELNMSLAVLEHSLPGFFRGVESLYHLKLGQPHRNRQAREDSISPQARQLLGQRLAMEQVGTTCILLLDHTDTPTGPH